MHDYEEALNALRAHAQQGKRVWIDPDSVNFAFANVVAKSRYVWYSSEGNLEHEYLYTLRCQCTLSMRQKMSSHISHPISCRALRQPRLKTLASSAGERR